MAGGTGLRAHKGPQTGFIGVSYWLLAVSIIKKNCIFADANCSSFLYYIVFNPFGVPYYTTTLRMLFYEIELDVLQFY